MNANVNPGLLAYVEIREKYFGATSAVMTLEKLCTEITNKYSHLEVTDMAMVGILVKADYEKAKHVERLKDETDSLKIRNARLMERLIDQPSCDHRRSTHEEVIKMIPGLMIQNNNVPVKPEQPTAQTN